MGDGVAGDEGVAARTPFCTLAGPASIDGEDCVLCAVLLAFEFLLKTLDGLVEGAVSMDEVLELDGHGVALVGHLG